MIVLDLPDEDATTRLASALALLLHPTDAILLDGPLGAGKTTFARALLRAACHDPELAVPSPTYTLRQDYESPHGPFAHFDLWRLDDPAALEELGWRDALAGIVLVEWPDRLAGARPSGALTMMFRADLPHAPPDHRRVTAEGWPADRLARLRDRFETTR